jgi:hypothetical protein
MALKEKKEVFSEEILGLLKKALAMLGHAPQNIAVRGAIIKLDASIGSLSQSGLFNKEKKEGAKEK